MKNGFIIIDKPEGISSQSAVNRVKRLLGADKAGHTGTLDPLATGVLPVLINRGVKASEYIITKDKHYLATLLLGVETDTEDITGAVMQTSEEIPSEDTVMAAIYSMLGKSLQTPPMYSALKVGGRKLYELARAGEEIEREAREIEIYSIKAERITEREYSIDVKCSKGTYIRSLCRDIGRKLGCGGTMKALRRMDAGGFMISDSVALQALEEMSAGERLALVHPTEELFGEYASICLQDFFARLAKSGLEIYLEKIGKVLNLHERVKLYDKNGFFALGEVREFEKGLAIKPIKQFEI